MLGFFCFFMCWGPHPGLHILYPAFLDFSLRPGLPESLRLLLNSSL